MDVRVENVEVNINDVIPGLPPVLNIHCTSTHTDSHTSR